MNTLTVHSHPVAFAFDIDGVLVKGKFPLFGAKETLELLQRLKIPFIFLTNGGGLTEEEHVAKLSMRLSNLPIRPGQFVQSHSPFHELVPEYRDQTVLCLGGHSHNIRQLAKAYGFNRVVTSSDVLKECEHVHPFPEMTAYHHAKHGIKSHAGVEATQIAAILIWSSPRDWCLDIQLVCDLLLSERGIIGTRSARNGNPAFPNFGYQQDNQPKLFFSNPDFEWATEHNQPRFAQGAFREALKGVWEHATRKLAALEYHVVGKPTQTTYQYAEKVLRGYEDPSLDISTHGLPREVRTVYMIGDNPESDIAGASSFDSPHGIHWKSVLVETGVYEAGTIPTYEPTNIAQNVEEAVKWALQEEGVDLGGEQSGNRPVQDLRLGCHSMG